MSATVVTKLNKFEDENVLKDLLNIVINLSKNEQADGYDDIGEFAKTQG